MEKAAEEFAAARAELVEVRDELAKRPTKGQVWTAIGILLVLLVASGLFGWHKVVEDDQQNAQIALALDRANRIDFESKVAQCASSNGSRKAVQTLLDEVASGESGVTDFSQIGGFEALDAKTQAYLNNLTEAQKLGGPGVVARAAENYRETNPQQDCKKVEADLRKKLDLVEEKAED